MNGTYPCPVCLSAYGPEAEHSNLGWGSMINCTICGPYTLTLEAYDDYLDKQSAIGSKLSQVERSHIAHKIKLAAKDAQRVQKYSAVNGDLLDKWKADGFSGPTPSMQAVNAVKYIGDKVSKTGNKIRHLPEDFFAIIGAPNPDLAGELLIELHSIGELDGIVSRPVSGSPTIVSVNLTLNGWQTYEKEQKGKLASNYGFLAMKFDQEALEKLVRDSVKPELKAQLNFSLQDMRDVARAGIIDNIMRAQIRDAAFVIVDLTHDNAGAYWEAGYAEGLGKPVIYICEKSKFDDAKTHFDTNHCTTVMWEDDKHDLFVRELVATIRRSLNLF